MPSAFSRRQSVSTRPSTGVRRSIRSEWATSSHSSTNHGWTPDSAARSPGSSPAVSRPWIASKRSHSASATDPSIRGSWSSSRERIAFPHASAKVRPMPMTSPTDFICVVSPVSAPGNFSNAKRGSFTTT
jgi:hypothetical protein